MDDFSNICLDIENDFQKITEVNSQINGTIEFKNKGSEEEHQEQVKMYRIYFPRRNFQANLSRLWNYKVNKGIRAVDIYRQLRLKNPSPFSGLVNYKKIAL